MYVLKYIKIKASNYLKIWMLTSPGFFFKEANSYIFTHCMFLPILIYSEVGIKDLSILKVKRLSDIPRFIYLFIYFYKAGGLGWVMAQAKLVPAMRFCCIKGGNQYRAKTSLRPPPNTSQPPSCAACAWNYAFRYSDIPPPPPAKFENNMLAKSVSRFEETLKMKVDETIVQDN